jgi:hypothetical protein
MIVPLFQKIFGVLVFMAGNTVFSCLLWRDLPFVRFVAILAGQIHLQMHLMPADI